MTEANFYPSSGLRLVGDEVTVNVHGVDVLNGPDTLGGLYTCRVSPVFETVVHAFDVLEEVTSGGFMFVQSAVPSFYSSFSHVLTQADFNAQELGTPFVLNARLVGPTGEVFSMTPVTITIAERPVVPSEAAFSYGRSSFRRQFNSQRG